MKIEIKNLKKSYNGIPVLDLRHLVFPENAVTAVVGPNGAGKSTLLNLIAGLIEKDSGEIFYDGKERVPARRMTLVFQEPYLISSGVRENIAWPLKLRKAPAETVRQRVETLAEELNLQPLLSKRANQLSLGEMQKVALARALSFEPELLLLDEPSASIDPYTTGEMEKLLKKQNREKKMTMILVTHNLAQAKRLADYVVLLNRGNVVESGDADRFFNHPSQPETEKFIRGELVV